MCCTKDCSGSVQLQFQEIKSKIALQIMSHAIVCELEDSWQRRFVYYTQNENYILIQQKKIAKIAVGFQLSIASYQKKFVNFVATLPDRSTEENFTKTVLTADGYSEPRKMPFLFPYDIDTLSPNAKRVLCRDD